MPHAHSLEGRACGKTMLNRPAWGSVATWAAAPSKAGTVRVEPDGGGSERAGHKLPDATRRVLHSRTCATWLKVKHPDRAMRFEAILIKV